MATANFTFSPDPATASLVDHFVLTTSDASGNVVNTQVLPASATSASVPGLAAAPYRAILQAFNAAGVADSKPPAVLFTPPSPPPTVPGDPTLNQPTFTFP